MVMSQTDNQHLLFPFFLLEIESWAKLSHSITLAIWITQIVSTHKTCCHLKKKHSPLPYDGSLRSWCHVKKILAKLSKKKLRIFIEKMQKNDLKSCAKDVGLNFPITLNFAAYYLPSNIISSGCEVIRAKYKYRAKAKNKISS